MAAAGGAQGGHARPLLLHLVEFQEPLALGEIDFGDRFLGLLDQKLGKIFAADLLQIAVAKVESPPRPTFNRQSFTRFIMIFLGLLAIYAIISPEVGAGFAAIAKVVLYPVIGFGGLAPVLTILCAGILTTTVSSVIRDYYTNWVKMARSQKITAAWRKEHMEAMRKGQTTKVEKLKEFQQTIQKDQMEMMTTPYKSMAWTMFLFIVIFTWLRLFVDVDLQNLGNQWIAVPWSSHVYLNDVYVLPAWVLLYSLLAIPFGQIITRVLKYIRFKRRLEQMGVPLRAPPGDA